MALNPDPFYQFESQLPTTGATALVTSGFTTAQAYAAEAFSEAIAFLSEISATATKLEQIAPVDGNLPPVSGVVDAFNMPALPVAPVGLTMNLPPVPAQPTVLPVTGITVGDAPSFSATLPVVNFAIPVPAPLTASTPLAPALPDVAIPASPTVVLPDVPTLLGIDVPTAPLLNLPTFTAVQPDSPLAPDYIFSFSEQAYTSQLLQDLRTQLDAWVNGASTGLAPAVEQAIWSRDRTRELAALSRKYKESIRMFAARGFSKPPGALDIDLQQAMQDSMATQSGLSRDIMIKQADLEQTNRRFAFEQAWKVEEGLITYTNQISQRAFDAARYAQQIGIDIFQAVVARYRADVEAYQVDVDVYKAALQAELTKLDVYKALLQGQQLIGTLNAQSVDIYKAKISAAQTLVEVFRAQVEAANTSAMVNKTQIESYAAQVGAYAEIVRAKAAEYDAYATQVKAEVSKVDAFSAEAAAYNSEVQGFKATVEALAAAKDIEIRVNQQTPLDLFKALTDVYRTQVDAESSRVGAVVKSYEAQTQAFTAEVQGEASRIGSEVDVYKSNTALAVAQGNLRIEAAKANIANLVQSVNLLIESIKGGAQVAAQLAAASLSSINLSGQIGDHSNYSVGYSNSISTSDSTSNSTSNSTSDVTSTSTSTSTSDSSSTISATQNSVANNTNTNYNYTP